MRQMPEQFTFLSAPDGRQELYVGLTDRSVVLYRWSEEGRSLQATNSFKLPGQVCSVYILPVASVSEYSCVLIINQWMQ